MSIRIELDESTLKSFSSIIDKRRDEIQAQVSELIAEDKKLGKIKEAMDNTYSHSHYLTASEPEQQPTVEGYIKKWIWQDKIGYVIEEAKAALTSNEIIARILEIEPYLDKNKTSNSISATLSVHSKEGKKFEVAGTNDKRDNLYKLRDVSELDW